MAFSRYGFGHLTPSQREDVVADLKTLVRERGTWDNVTMNDFDKICQANGLDYDYLGTLFNLAKKAFKGNLKEDNIISKTGSDGETSFEAVPEDVARQLNGTTTTDTKGNKTTVKDTGKKTLGELEGPGKATLNQQDILNLAKDLEVCTKEALRATGNKVAYTQVFFNKAKATLTVKAYFQQDADNPGKPEGQEFPYKLAEGKVVLVTNDGQTVTNVAAIQTQSGTANVNRDIATDSIKKVISREEADATGEAGTSEPDSDVNNKPMLENFSKAVDAYRKNKSKETIKELLRSARDFPGDDIQHKFQNAIQMYKGQGCQNPDSGEYCSDGQCMSDCELKLSESLFLRLLEFAKEDAQSDVDLHTVSENLSRICSEGKCASIEDYETILGTAAKEDPEDMPKDTEDEPVITGEEPGQLQEVSDPVSKLVGKINDRSESDYIVYIETGKDEGGYLEGKPTDRNMTKDELISFLQANQGKIDSCYMPGKGIVQVNFRTGEMLQENEPDEVEDWDDGRPSTPEDAVFYYDSETRKVFDEWHVPAGQGRKFITGTISCLDTNIFDESFSHEFGTEHVYVPICTQVGIEIEGISDDQDFYDSPEDQEHAKSLLTKEDYKIIEDWGKEWMTDHMEA